jgi:hypothetical protein
MPEGDAKLLTHTMLEISSSKFISNDFSLNIFRRVNECLSDISSEKKLCSKFAFAFS